MTRRFERAVTAAITLALGGCSVWHAQPLPTPASRDNPGTGRLRAGAARVDITPPPGVGMGGSGPEGRRSTGYRTRLYAGALVLEDAAGERIALVVADLPHVSANLHRLAAGRLVETTGIGADRLIVSATHTHSGPAHFYGERQYNANASRVPGYDPHMADFLVGRITDAVQRAVASLRPARLASGSTAIVGATTNRSIEAFCLNPEAKSLCGGRGGRANPDHAVDTMLVMLRVDKLDTLTLETRPLASYSVFALHGTAIPSVNTLLDGDVHVRIVERLSTHADSTAGDTGTVHLLANGAEGDVAPKIERYQCDVPKLGPVDPVSIPRGSGEIVDFLEPSVSRVQTCLEDALHDVDQLADKVAASAASLFDFLGGHLRDGVEVRRAFMTVWLPGHDGLCGSPELGSSVAAGAELLETRVRGWRWLAWPIPLALEEGGAAVQPKDGACQSPKRTLLDPIQARYVVGEHGFPETAQFTVFRVDSLLLAAVPAEVTTVVGTRIRNSMTVAARSAGATPAVAAVIGLANGFLQYITTEEEYQWQAYEGGSNLYGPRTARFFERRLTELAARLPPPGEGRSPIVEIGPITAYPGPSRSIVPSPSAGPAGPINGAVTVRCKGRALVADWLDLAPGRLFPRPLRWVALERQIEPGRWEQVATDGDGRLEIYAIGSRGKGFAWRAVWRAVNGAGPFRLARLDDAGTPQRISEPATCR